MKQKFLICRHCGNIVAVIRDQGVPIFCCGEKVYEITPSTAEASEEKHFTDIGYRSYPMVNAKLAVEAAIMQMGNAYTVDLSGYADEEVVFTNASGDEFVFETDISGNLSCVLPDGEYTVESRGAQAEITVDKDTAVNLI